MRVYMKGAGIYGECWVEIFEDGDWKVISESRLLFTEKEIIVDVMTVYPPYQFKGYGSEMIKKMKATGKKVVPAGVLKHAEGFWDKVTPGWRKHPICRSGA